MSKSNRKYAFVLILSALIISVFSFRGPGERYFEIAKNLDIFATLFKEVNAYYVDEVNPNTLIKTGIDAMLGSLDPYTNYIPEDDIEDYRTLTTGQYGGIGALIGQINGRTLITMPHEGYPAHRAGLRIGDEIIEVDGIDVKNKNTSEVSEILKGQARTDISIKVKRFGTKDPIEFHFKREKITIDNVPYYGKLNDRTGYIKLTDFTTGAGHEVGNALKEMKAEGITSVILDLRGNPGGLLNEAINVSNVFVPKGSEIVSTKGKVTEWNKNYKALNNPVDIKIPLVVLINGGSASASEIVAGVMQDYDRGVLIGQKTFGKGLVQATRPLTYNSQLKVTTAKYYTPTGRCIQAIDYSRRKEDGSIGKIHDSLKVEFKTGNGRSVYDGGGIDPDFPVDNHYLSPITISLITNGLIFDYSTQYFYNNEKILPPAKFRITDEEYNKFIEWLSDKEYDYTTGVEKNIEELIKSAKEEKYYGDIEDKILELKEKVKHNKKKDLVSFKEEIIGALEQEIVSRYYLNKGEVETTLSKDPNVLKALEILEQPALYKMTLFGK